MVAAKVTWRPFGSALVYGLVFACVVTQSVLVRAQAQSNTLSTEQTQKVFSQSPSAGELASQWGLTDTQWVRYQKIMSQKRGVWSPGLDPLTALGASAETASERKHYAELYVRAEFERVRKELAFQIEVEQAWKRLYPDTPRLTDATRAKADTRPVQRYAVVVSPDCMTCTQVIKNRLTWLAKTPGGQAVDVHVVGTGGEDGKLRDWLKNNQWAREL
jgi:integrating conjugative element protein (TIGR03759 family)